uniref:Nuclear transcription factor Y subunit n=1 Tax=Nicotiana sylvestris TaxID=4096 RepID=A0A1U7XP73_NICSY|nr:PREDICTED: nuclear transcription factor Y subunit A-4-like isoform X1 [Nicotiana sylvestris]XP_009793847.1 PREDICTED: nuclear transcription factor Y subunit A-4-like isoform X1 [Nicotiana sylvestris]XP_009793848.1 PREDICTED: nuclear transcription factor Y subunit A-4-like isoform X1 [Nicotiana sylvestris]XP_009793849.1 PREDICTED: nuclear transcription factor Y subunit A-4-like isoform X1 [Nicotiana sylvestris]XP_009793850.1 PREDICTED: nuclear transcription factor Y subunit A-4-like isoform X
MAVRAQALPNRSLEQTSTCFVPHFAVNSSTWWSSNEVQSSQSLPKNLTSEVVFQPPPCQQMKPLGLGLQGDDSYSTQSNSNSPLEVTALGKTGSQDQCASSGSVHDESYKRNKQAQIKTNPFIRYPEYPTDCSQSEMAHSISHAPFGYSDPYLSGFYAAYGPHVFSQNSFSSDIWSIQPQMIGIAPARVPLPLDLAEDGPVYVNAKQYHGILRRRQMRAKLEAQNKLVKARKPYLHESRHLHAVKRVRGSGGRFLSTKKLQESIPNDLNSSQDLVTREAHTSAFLSVRQDAAHNSVIFQQQQHDHRASSLSSHMAVSMQSSRSTGIS